MIGSRYSHFEIERLLGTGGMGEVYLAIDMNLERRVALKFLPRSLTSDRTAQGRLLDEARSCARLQHPNIAVIHSVEEDGGVYAICMEYVEGANLREILATRRLDIRRIVEIALGTARGIAAAHDHGLIHRDIKPANVVITGKGRVKVMDFGLALRPRRSVETTGPESYGTVAYMSPEQARGQELTPATDIFSFGSLLYQMVTGRLPFKGENDLATLQAIISDEPEPIRELRRDVPPGLERLITSCLQKDPSRRPESMDTVVAQLQRLSGSVKQGPSDLIFELTTGLETESLRRRHSGGIGPLGSRATETRTGRTTRRSKAPAPFAELELPDAPTATVAADPLAPSRSPSDPAPVPSRHASDAASLHDPDPEVRRSTPVEEPPPLLKSRLSRSVGSITASPASAEASPPASREEIVEESSLAKPLWKTAAYGMIALALAAAAVLALQFLVIQSPPPPPPSHPASSLRPEAKPPPPARRPGRTASAHQVTLQDPVEPLPEMIDLEPPPTGA